MLAEGTEGGYPECLKTTVSLCPAAEDVEHLTSASDVDQEDQPSQVIGLN